MRDKTVLVTGASGGIGQQTALALAKLGARVVVTGRSRARGEAAVVGITELSGKCFRVDCDQVAWPAPVLDAVTREQVWAIVEDLSSAE